MDSKEIDFQSEAALNMLSKVTQGQCNKHPLLFARIVRRLLLEQGVAEATVNAVLEEAKQEYGPECYEVNSQCAIITGGALKDYYSGDEEADILGRILVHFCFMAPNAAIKVYGDGDEQEMLARRQFTPNVLARPVMRYFLISVRGTLEGVDPYMSLPALFGTDMEDINTLTEKAMQIAEHHRHGSTPDKPGPVHWGGFYKEPNARKLALFVVGQALKRIQAMGLDRYLQVLENYQAKRRSKLGSVLMERALLPEDAQQIVRALDDARKRLQASLAG